MEEYGKDGVLGRLLKKEETLMFKVLWMVSISC